MKTKKCIWSLLLVICCLTSSAMASGLGDIRINARFLTDRMAFELNLTQTQYNDLYEVKNGTMTCAGFCPVPSMCGLWHWIIFSVRFMR